MKNKQAFDGFENEEVTVVTACDKKYVGHLRVSLPNWIEYKKINQFPFIIYVNGFAQPDKNQELQFIRDLLPNVRLIDWDIDVETQRERMLSAFVLGTARDVETTYWLKLDADSYATDNRPLLSPAMRDYVFCGHKWGYSYLNLLVPLVEWANQHPAFKNTPQDFLEQERIDGRRYRHRRSASFVQLHQTSFVRDAAEIAGDRLPVPSHDTYLWYVANRLQLPYMLTNFKRMRGMSNKSSLNGLIENINRLKQ